MGDELKKMLEDINKKFDEAVQNRASKEELDALKKSIDDLNALSTDKMKELEDTLKAQGEKLLGYEQKNDGIPESEMEQIKKVLVDKQDEIKANFEAGHGVIEFEVKAVGTMMTGSGTMINNPRALGPLVDINLRPADLTKYASHSETGRGQFSYTECVPKDGEALNVAEGEAKPQIDFKWEERWVNPTKVAAWIKLTEESVEDVIGLTSVARNFLRKKHDIQVEKDIYFGDNTGANSEGATTIGRSFNAGDMANKVERPSLIDVINACIVDIASAPNYVDEDVYITNVAFINPVDFFLNFAAKKDANGLPMYPNASLFNEIKIGPLTIIPTFRIPAGKIFIADMKKYNVVTRKSYVVKVGWVNDDFIKNQHVILGESRYFAYVQNLDRVAFIYDDIATISAAIEAPATTKAAGTQPASN